MGTDTFTYTLSNGFAQSSATVTINVTNAVAQQGAFVDAATGNDATGNVATGAPFATIQAAVTAAGQNADVVVRPGNYTGTVTLLNGQRLLGAGSTLVNNQGAQRPVLTGSVVLADGNTVDFIRIVNSAADAIDGNGQNGGTISRNEIVNAGEDGVGLEDVTGEWRVEENLVDNSAELGILIGTEGSDTAVTRVNRNTVSNSRLGGTGFVTSNASQLRVQFNENVLTNNPDGFSFEVVAGGSSVATFQIVGNRNDDVYRMSVVSNSTASIRVERLSQLPALNNGSGTVVTGGGSIPPTDVPQGAAGF